MNTSQQALEFYLPFGGTLDPQNRWVVLSEQIPWDYVEEEYAKVFPSPHHGYPALSARIALGALIIKERMKLNDRETVEQIRENPYLQYFLGLKEYTYEPLFDPSMMVHFRKRFGKEILADINTRIVEKASCGNDSAGDDNDPDDSTGDGGDVRTPDACGTSSEEKGNSGKLIIDATCSPADIPYPTDIGLLNEAREKSEEIIDRLHAPYIGTRRKPRTYRRKARNAYIRVIKRRSPGVRKIRKCIRVQLSCLRRNFGYIDAYLSSGDGYRLLGRRLYSLLFVVKEVYRQQEWMYRNRCNTIADRVVNLYQPYVRPMVRGKAGRPVEFGAKLSVSVVDGLCTVDRLSWDAYNESGDLTVQANTYKQRYGYYPASIHADKIYRTRANRRFCAEHGIRLSGPPLGRPPKPSEANRSYRASLKRIQAQDERDRQAVEGVFGVGKRRYSLNRIMGKLATTSESIIMMSFIVMNLEKMLRASFLSFFIWFCTRMAPRMTLVGGINGLLLRFGARISTWKTDRYCRYSTVTC